MDASDDPRSRALNLLTLALQILDENDVPADIGAHVDVAIARLSDAIDQSGQEPHQVSQ